MTSSQRKRAQLAAKLRHEELERKSEAAVRLAKEKQKLQEKQKEEKHRFELELEQEKHKLELEAIEEENRAKLVESKIGMLELQDDDESQVSIDDQVLGTDDTEIGTEVEWRRGWTIRLTKLLLLKEK